MKRFIAVALVSVAVSSCRSAAPVEPQSAPLVQPGAPGQASHPIAPAKAADQSKVQFTAADVKFMQGMIGHHQQAVDMTALLYTRTSSNDMKMLAKRIDISQQDEIKMMRRWLEVRGQEIPSEHAMHMHGATLMPGMLTEEEMARLAQAKGPDFDILFLEGMIKHHGGALTMVHELFATPGAGQDSEMFGFASDVEADQQAEIDRMSAMLGAMLKERQ